MNGDLHVRLFGAFEIEGLDLLGLRSRKSRTLLKVLALGRGQSVTVDRLVDSLWSGEPPRQPEREVSVHVSRARKLLGGDRLERSDAGYRLLVDWLDLEALEVLADEAAQRLRAGDHVAARAAAGAALTLARGPLLADEPDAPWVEVERIAATRRVADLHHVAAQAALAVGELGEASVLAGEALDHDPYDEVALRVLMSAHASAGRPGSALAAYAAVRERLVDDLGASPTAETEALHGTILREETIPGTPTPDDATARSSAPVGRSDEIDRLEKAWDRASTGVEVIVVEGEAGIGKSHLLAAFVANARARGRTVLQGHCDEVSQDLPLQAVADALAVHLHAIGRTAAAQLLGADAAVLAPLLGATDAQSDVDPQAGSSAGPRAEAAQAVVFAALLRVFGRAGQGGPAALVLDDVHQADPSTVSWLAFALRRRSEVGLLIVVSRRPEEGTSVPAGDTITLGPLDLAAVRQVVGPERADLLYQRSSGHPLLLTELAACADDDEIPASLRATVAARCARSGAAEATTLRVAAVLGPDVDLDLLSAVVEQPPLVVLGHLEDAVARRFLEERGSRFVFRHELVREALAADTSASRRAFVHRRASEVLAARAEGDPLQLANHARSGGDDALASTALVEAAQRAARRFDAAAAERLLDEALALADTPAARLARGRVRLWRGDPDGADDDAVVALREGGAAAAIDLRAWVARTRHDFASAIRLGEEGARTADDVDIRASCLLVVAFARRGQGDLREAEQVLEGELLALDSQADLGLHAWLGILRVHQGRPHEGLELLEPAIGGEVDLLHAYWVEHVMQMTIHAYGMLGQPAAALTLAERLRGEMKRRGSDARYAGLAENYRSWIARSLGALDEAWDLSVESAVTAPTLEVQTQARLDLAEVRLREGEVDEAEEHVRQVDDLLTAEWIGNGWRCTQRRDLLNARIANARRDHDLAEELAHTLERSAADRGEARYQLLASLVGAEARARRGDALDRGSVGADLDRLPQLAALEAWWLTADLAEAADSEDWWSLAQRRVAELARAAGERRATFEAFATAAFATRRR